MSRKFTCASTGAASVHWRQHVSWSEPAFQLEVISQIVISAGFDGDPFEVSWRTHMLVRTVVHQNVHNMPLLGLVTWFSVSDRCQYVSSFVLFIFVLIRLGSTVPSVILGDSRDLTGGGSSCRSCGRLCRSGDFVYGVLSFALAFAFLALAVAYVTLGSAFEPAVFGHVTDTSAHGAARFLPVSLVLSLALVALASLCQSIELHVIWPFPVVGRHCQSCLILGVVLHELKSHFCHRFEGVQILHLEWDSHR